jgi:hypothetical protein
MDKITTQMVMNWLQPKGEIIVIQRPSTAFDIRITTDKAVYMAGDEVNYEISVYDSKGRLASKRDIIVNLVATDDSVFTKVEDRKLPASLGAALYIENEVGKNNYELYYANQYIDHWFT